MSKSNREVGARDGLSGDSTGMAWIVGFFFGFRLAIPILSMRLFGVDPRAGTAIRLGLGFFLFLLVTVTSLGTAQRGVGWLMKASSVRWALFFLAFSASTLLWGEAASASASATYWLATVADVATVFLLFRNGLPPDIAASFMQGFVWAACCIACIAWVMPTQYDLRLGDEDFFNSNSICNVCVFAVFFAHYLMRQRRAKLGIVMLFLILTILRSLSKATIAAFLAAEIYLIIQDRSMTRGKKLVLTIVGIGIILVFWGLFESYYDLYTTTGNQAETLTGRTAIWAYVLDALTEHPWIGHGFDSMWNVVPVFGTFEARHAENEVLEQLYSYGAVGIVMLCAIYGSLYHSFRRLAPPRWRVIGLSMLLFVVVRGIAEAEPFDLLLPLWMVVLWSALLEHEKAHQGNPSIALPDDVRMSPVPKPGLSAARPNCHPIVIS
jgi:exopolysaccharide production protein ExoQ